MNYVELAKQLIAQLETLNGHIGRYVDHVTDQGDGQDQNKPREPVITDAAELVFPKLPNPMPWKVIDQAISAMNGSELISLEMRLKARRSAIRTTYLAGNISPELRRSLNRQESRIRDRLNWIGQLLSDQLKVDKW